MRGRRWEQADGPRGASRNIGKFGGRGDGAVRNVYWGCRGRKVEEKANRGLKTIIFLEDRTVGKPDLAGGRIEKIPWGRGHAFKKD